MIRPTSITLLILALVSTLLPLSAEEATLKTKYRAVQVDRFEIKEGVQFPSEALVSLQEEILKNLAKSKEFQELLRPDENPSSGPDMAVLRVTGTITSFKPGNRTKRYTIGFGAGSAEIYAHVVFLDRATGRTLSTEDVRAVLTGGAFGGKSTDATADFANQVSNTIRVSLRKRATADSTSADPPSPTRSAFDHHEITISSEDWEEATRKLNQEGAAGYRIVGLAPTGKKMANVTLEKFSDQGDAYEYRIFHPLLYSSLQKDLNGAAQEGFRYCRHSLMVLGKRVSLIAEKGVVSSVRYDYRVHGTVRLSSAQHDVEKDQGEGYELVDEAETGVHMVVLEKAIPEK